MNKLSHVGIIMDGNGRWAGSRDFKRYFGHEKAINYYMLAERRYGSIDYKN